MSLVYLAAVATYWMWWGGVPATPARFGAAVLPALAAPLAIGWRRSAPGLRALWNLLLVISAGLTILLVGVDRGALAWNVRGPSAAWLEWPGAIADLARAWPSFFWRLTPGDVSTEGHFALHVAIWLVVFAVAAWAALLLVRRVGAGGGNGHLVATGACSSL